MINLIENELSVEEYLYLRNKVNWKQLSNRQAEMAIKNSLYKVKAVDESGNVVGMGRVVGDGAVICYIQDLIVLPEAQGKKVGSAIIEKLTEYVRKIHEPGTNMMLCLMCAKGREPFYLKHGFIDRPTENLGPGMIKYIE